MVLYDNVRSRHALAASCRRTVRHHPPASSRQLVARSKVTETSHLLFQNVTGRRVVRRRANKHAAMTFPGFQQALTGQPRQL